MAGRLDLDEYKKNIVMMVNVTRKKVLSVRVGIFIVVSGTWKRVCH